MPTKYAKSAYFRAFFLFITTKKILARNLYVV